MIALLLALALAATDVDGEAALRAAHARIGALYPCFAPKSIDWEATRERLLPAARAAGDDEALGLVMVQLVAALEDSHAVVMPGTRPVPALPLPRYSPGVACLEDDRGRVVVYAIDPAGPAAAARLRPGDVVRTIDGRPAAEAIADLDATMRRWVGHSSDRVRRHDAHRAVLARRAAGTAVTIEVERGDGTALGLRLRADSDRHFAPRLPIPAAGDDSRDVRFARLAPDVAYLRIRRIRAGLEAGIDAALAALPGCRGLVIDLRGNTGGGFDRATAHRAFDPERPVEEGPRWTGPIVILTDARTISAAEGWASWFRATGRATFVGETTAGASSRKTEIELADGRWRARIPTKAYAGFLDRPIERRGIEPDLAVRPRADDLAAGRDTALEAAVALLGNAP